MFVKKFSRLLVKVFISILKLFEPDVSYTSDGQIKISMKADERTIEAFQKEWGTTPPKAETTHTIKKGFLIYDIQDAINAAIGYLEHAKYFTQSKQYRCLVGKPDEKTNYDITINSIPPATAKEPDENDPRI